MKRLISMVMAAGLFSSGIVLADTHDKGWSIFKDDKSQRAVPIADSLGDVAGGIIDSMEAEGRCGCMNQFEVFVTYLRENVSAPDETKAPEISCTYNKSTKESSANVTFTSGENIVLKFNTQDKDGFKLCSYKFSSKDNLIESSFSQTKEKMNQEYLGNACIVDIFRFEDVKCKEE